MLYDYVRSAISLIETGEEKVQQTRELMMGELVIGASDTVTRSLLLPYLQRFHERYPAIRLKVLNGTSYEALQMLRAGQVDLAFASTPQESGNLQMRRCMALHNVFVAGRDYPCETDRAYTLAELSRFPLMLLERKSSARRYLERFFTRNGITLKPEIEFSSIWRPLGWGWRASPENMPCPLWRRGRSVNCAPFRRFRSGAFRCAPCRMYRPAPRRRSFYGSGRKAK